MPATTGTPLVANAGGTFVSGSLTIPAGADRVVVIEGGFNVGQTDCTGVTLDGDAMTQVGTNVYDGGGRHCSAWEMRSTDANWPGTGSFTVAATAAAGRTSIAIVAFCIEDSADSAPSGVNPGTGSGATPSIAVTSSSGDLVVGGFSTYSAARGAAGGSDTEIEWYFGDTGDASLLAFETPGATSTTFDWTYGSSVAWAGIAFSIPDAGGGGGGDPTAMIFHHLRMMKQR